MPIIKLDAIDSTNDYLKQLSKKSILENYTIVMASEQTKGKGQMGAKWVSEKGKNLTMSILVKDVLLTNKNIFDLNIIIAVSVLNVLKKIKIPKVTIKWPNDIMSDSKKVAGILIENSLKPDGSFNSIVGIGLNLNQTNFENLPQATSLTCITNETYDIEELAVQLKNSLEENLQILIKSSDILWDEYHKNLFKKEYPTPFEDNEGKRFMGIIKKVTREGKLKVLLHNDSIVLYEIKEVKMLY